MLKFIIFIIFAILFIKILKRILKSKEQNIYPLKDDEFPPGQFNTNMEQSPALAEQPMNEVSFPAFHIHEDIKDLLWFADGPMKNITPGDAIHKYNINGVTILFADPGMEEPSMIFTKHPIELPHTSDVPRPSYYPTYETLSPEQKGVYIKFLENPYNPNIDIGFVFILYYGLERHLLYGKWRKAAEVILKLRDIHPNKSFQSYSANAIVLTAIYRKEGDLVIELLKSIDKEFEIDCFPANLYFICAYSFNFPVTAKDIIRYASWFGFDNKNYIKKLPELFKTTLSKHIKKLTGNDFIWLQDLITPEDMASMPSHEMTIFANTSLRETKVAIPSMTESKKLKETFFKLLSETHEDVKKTAAEMRKNGELKPEPKKIPAKNTQQTMAQYKERLEKALSLIPLPNAYWEAAIALRGLRRTDKDNADKYLEQLYDVAVKNSLYIAYSEYCECPGYNIIETIPATVVNELEYSYKEIGYEKLTILNKTDIKAITELWGEPDNHSTLNEKYKELWRGYEMKYIDSDIL